MLHFRQTREGFDYQTGVNYLGHVELARILIEGLLLQQVVNLTWVYHLSSLLVSL